MASVEIKGWSEFEAKLRELEASMQRKALIEVAKTGAQIVLDDARSRAPRDSGDLAEGLLMRVDTKDTSLFEATVNVGINRRQFYGLFVEKGTKQRFFKKHKGTSGQMRAHPFLTPALETNRGRVVEAMKAKMAEIIKRIAK